MGNAKTHMPGLTVRGRRFWRLFGCACCLAWLQAALPVMAQSPPDGNKPAQVRIKAEAAVAGDRIRLGEVADIRGFGPQQDAFSQADLGAAPLPGMGKMVSGRKMVSLVKSLPGFPEDARVSVPRKVHIQRLSQIVPEDRLKALLAPYIDGSDFVLRRVSVRGKTNFPLGDLSLGIAEQKTDKHRRRLDAVVSVSVDGHFAGKLNISAWVDRFSRVVCLRRALARGTVLTAADLELKSLNIIRNSNNVIGSAQEAVGKQLKKSLEAGACLFRNSLVNPILVHKGDRVKLIVGGGSLRVATTGIAKSSGGAADQIRVENPGSERIVMGRVVDAETVEIVF
ncbi:MAG: flagellar basal body P-ring formation chaperone FlgA [Thermodesulfobacteriota bacterium]